MATNTCSSCAFFEDHMANTGETKKDAGLCRFNPPISQPEADARGLWPIVQINDWCGHFEKEDA
ncbi:hypothetical protein DSD19_14870 [Rhodovulum sp. BSW8]|uniref:Uncharacterized protein n=1 Tax=Rhodovulum visakhapatnamense TaxID=364297 RepID=A0A4R8G131_9RHOB|nr:MULTISPECIES: hypothetical protein [Rhodovulum]OLS43426.1 hypothetical protein BV509_03170 [Rhodovulum sulfidophilum]MBL3569969.1 hypothetical protein [Rhodovulum visakhapatnamense]MBL3578715.1 hypothetical protein [Rhodovulum visakhapatnamense]RBO52382.1 hypothetical protein DSD19_14870 [Rhodovulum sp. BSW8]TDX33279.1 hypothetical protein EV657_102156 [Rhodovulum visakhapatnamense]